MKKLVIMAALAASSVMVFAADVYDISISGRSTKGKNSSVIKKTYTANFGAVSKNSLVFWYSDAAITKNSSDASYGDVAGFEKVVVYDGEFKASRGHFSAFFDVLEPADKLIVVEALSFNATTGKTAYNYKSAGKWCESQKFTVVTDAECYAVDASGAVKGYLVMEDCCGAGWFICDRNFDNAESVDVLLYNRYNSNIQEKANKVEVLVSSGAFPTVSSSTFCLRGTYDCKNGRIASASGQFIGIEDAPVCATCCGMDAKACMFDCDGTKSAVDRPCLFNGTVSIKFNKTATDKYNCVH